MNRKRTHFLQKFKEDIKLMKYHFDNEKNDQIMILCRHTCCVFED